MAWMMRFSLVALAFNGCLCTAQAAGFFLQEQSVSGLGAAFAGQAAMPRDASTIFFNPAGMTRLTGTQAHIGIHVIAPHSTIDDTGTSSALPPAIGDKQGDNPYNPSIIPNLYISHQATDALWLGLGVNVPYGMTGDYGRDWFGRYDSTASDLKTLNIAPSAAWRINARWSIGGGIDIQTAKARLDSMAYSSGLGSEVHSRLRGDGVGAGYNLGVLYQPNDDTTLGLHYRSAVRTTLKGGTVISTNQGAILSYRDAAANLELPDITSFGWAQKLSPRWTFLTQGTWFGWSKHEDITIDFVNGSDDQRILQHYRDTYAVALGMEYTASPTWTLRFGSQYDQTPTQDNFRTSRTPDGDRYWLAGGATYRLSDTLSVDGALTYIHITPEAINLPRLNNNAQIRAKTKGRVGIAAIGLNYRF